MANQDEIQRGKLAQQLVSNPLWLEAWQKFHEATLEKWEGTAAAHQEEREMLWLSLKVAKKIRLEIEEILRTGEWAEQQLQAKNAKEGKHGRATVNRGSN